MSKKLILIATAAALLTACSHQAAQESTQPTPSTAQAAMESTSPSPTAASDAAVTEKKVAGSEVLAVTLDMNDFAFSQKGIKAKPGQTVTVTVKNTAGFHDFVIDELNAKTKQLPAGQSETITFMIPEDASGKTYEYYCSVGQHRKMGMVGKLVVE